MGTTPSSPQFHVLAGSTGFRRGRFGSGFPAVVLATVVLATVLLAAAPVLAGSIEVEVRLQGKRPLVQAPVLLHPPFDPGTDVFERMFRPGTHRGFTDRRGVARFLGVPPGRYTVSFPQLPPELLQPSENPVRPAPVVTLFEDEETIRASVSLELGISVGVAVDTPGPARGYLVHFHHRETGFERVDEIRAAVPRLTRLLSEGAWDVWVTSPPGRILTHLEHDGHALPGAVAPLELELPTPPVAPETTWLTFAYSAPAAVEGDVIVKGGPLQEVEIVATLTRPGEWLEAAEERGGSLYSPVTVPLLAGGRYRLDLPAGAWKVSPHGPRIVTREPQEVIVEARDSEVVEADFEVELDTEPRRTFRVRVLNPRGEDLEGAVVQLFGRDDLSTVLRHGVTEPFGVELEVVPLGHYVLVAGHPDYLEAELALDDFESTEVPEVRIALSEGGYLDLVAVDLDGRPARWVEWTVEHLDPPLELKIRDGAFLESKKKRVAVTDDSGRARLPGLYGGFYRLAAERPAYGQNLRLGGLFRVRHREGRWTPTVELYLPEGGSDEAVAHQLPAANLRFQLLCDDNGPPPEEASVVVIDLDGPAGDIEAAKEAAVLARHQVPLGGRDRDLLLVGPLDQGVYRLALRPAGFTRWTWAYETHDGTESYAVQIDVDEKEPAALLDQGPFQLECDPAVDIVPEPPSPGAKLPDLRDVRVRARLLDVDRDVETASAPSILRRRDRAELRGLPRGPVRLDFVLSHPHFLPHPDLNYQVDLDLRRGQYLEVTPRIVGLGGAIEVEGWKPDRPGALLRVEAEGAEPLEVPYEAESALVPSLQPGTFTVILCGDPACEEPRRRWEGVEVRRGHTALLEAGP